MVDAPGLWQLTHTALADVLHLHDPSSTPSSLLFPSLAQYSLDELIEVRMYLKTQAAEVAATAAPSAVAADSSLAVDRPLVCAHAIVHPRCMEGDAAIVAPKRRQ